jgi:hypothetical protein
MDISQMSSDSIRHHWMLTTAMDIFGCPSGYPLTILDISKCSGTSMDTTDDWEHLGTSSRYLITVLGQFWMSSRHHQVSRDVWKCPGMSPDVFRCLDLSKDIHDYPGTLEDVLSRHTETKHDKTKQDRTRQGKTLYIVWIYWDQYNPNIFAILLKLYFEIYLQYAPGITRDIVTRFSCA